MPHHTSPTTLSVVIPVGKAGRSLRPTVRSVLRGLDRLTADGAQVELLLVEGDTDHATRSEVAHWEVADPGRIRVVRDTTTTPASARNAGIATSSGEFVCVVGPTDLLSSDFFAAGIAAAGSSAQDAIIHPGLVITFGETNDVWRPVSMEDVTLADALRHNPWPTIALAARDVFTRLPYASASSGHDFDSAEWLWNLETAAAGARHTTIPEATAFQRSRHDPRIAARRGLRILPPLDVDALARVLTSPPSTPTGSAFLGPLRTSTGSVQRVARAVRRRLPAGTRRQMDAVVMRLRGCSSPEPRSASSRDVKLQRDLREAAEIDPAVSWVAANFDSLHEWRATGDPYATIVTETLAMLPQRGGAVIAVPWLGVGGGDLVALNYARALQETDRFRGRVTILATHTPSKTVASMLPPEIHFVQMPERFGATPGEFRQRLLAQTLVLAAPDILISSNCFHLTDAMQVFGREITSTSSTYATLFAFFGNSGGFPSNAVAEEGLRPALDGLAAIITDNSITAAQITDILAITPPRLLVHSQPIGRESAAPGEQERSRRNAFSREHPFRLVWPHRLDPEKRPDALVAIAQEIERRGVPATIDVWGQRVISTSADGILARLERSGVVYRGPYSGGLTGIPSAEYDALLLTSESEGLPLVLVESLLLGLPVIASAVGGVPDLIIDRQTGLLAAGPDDVAGFVDAIEALIASAELRFSLAEAGSARAVERHSWRTFRDAVDDMLAALPSPTVR